jgi:hypothetical protein
MTRSNDKVANFDWLRQFFGILVPFAITLAIGAISLQAMEKAHIKHVLDLVGWRHVG